MARDDAERIIGLYDRHAAKYDELRDKTLFERPWLERFVALVRSGGAILDLGCGMGEPYTGYFIAHGFRVTGVDSSRRMIELCSRRFPDRSWIVADMRRVALGNQFDGIIAWDSFFHLTPDDQRDMFAVFATHACAHAALMFTSGPQFGERNAAFEGEPLYHASLDPDEYRSLLSRSGFEVVRYVAEDKTCGGHTIWLAKRV